MTRGAVLAALLLVKSVAASCHYGTTLFERQSNNTPNITAYGYGSLNGPLNWFGLNKSANNLCAYGQKQSPVDLNSTFSVLSPADVKFNITNVSDAELENLGTTLEVPANGSLVLKDKTYSLKQFHFHTPGEHHVNSAYYPLEVHFVFQAADETLAVVGFVIDLGASNSLFTSVFEHIDSVPNGGMSTQTGPLHFGSLQEHFAKNPSYTYSGSLTTPPCSESVTWIVNQKPLSVSPDLYTKVKDVIKFNARYIQDAPDSINLLLHSYVEMSS